MKETLIAIAVLVVFETGATASPTPEDLYTEGQASYDTGDYPRAIAKWQEAYRLSGASELLFNLAQAYRLNGNCERALSTYRQFITTMPTSEQHALATDLMHELEFKCGAHVPVVTDLQINSTVLNHPRLSVTEHLGERPGRALRIGGLAASGAGAVTLAIGLGLGHHGQTLGDEVTRACAVSCDWAAQEGKNSTGQRDVAIGRALDALGGAAIVGGAIAYYLGYREDGVAISPVSRESGAVVTWSGSW